MIQKFFRLKIKVPAFSLLEMLVASTMSAIIFGSALTVVSHLYYSQTRVELAQTFYAEARLLQERLSHTVRNSTIDYDRFWHESYNSGDNTTPLAQDLRNGATGTEHQCELGDWTNNYRNFNTASQLTYPDIFYWDTQNSLVGGGSLDGILDARLGKMNTKDNQDEDCKKVLQNTVSTLFLMSGDRTYRTKIAFKPCDTPLNGCGFQEGENLIVLERQLGHDADGDGLIDHWSTQSRFHNGTECQVFVDAPINDWAVVLGDKSDPDFCDLAHEEVIISPVTLEVQDLSFTVQPEADPYLNYEEDGFLKHPFVLWSMDIIFRDYEANGYTVERAPRMSFQTSVSTRVYGDTRPDVTNYIYRHCEDNDPSFDPLCKDIP